MVSIQIDERLRRELDGAYEKGALTDAEYRRLITFISEVVGPAASKIFLVQDSDIHGYTSVINEPKLQVLIVADDLIYDFVAGSNSVRYDVMPVSSINRVEERIEEEISVEGEPRTKVTINISYGATSALSSIANTLIAFGDQGRKLSAFARQLKDYAFSEG